LLDASNPERLAGLQRGHLPSLFSLFALCQQVSTIHPPSLPPHLLNQCVHVMVQAVRVVKTERNVLHIKGPVVVVGNIMAQHVDLLQILVSSALHLLFSLHTHYLTTHSPSLLRWRTAGNEVPLLGRLREPRGTQHPHLVPLAGAQSTN
jgi:hypothetical protein